MMRWIRRALKVVGSAYLLGQAIDKVISFEQWLWADNPPSFVNYLIRENRTRSPVRLIAMTFRIF
jgi:hypothetical protein